MSSQYSLLVYSTRTPDCLYHKSSWENEDISQKEYTESSIFALFYSLNRTAVKMSPEKAEGCFQCYYTTKYECHFYQSISGFIFVLLLPFNNKYEKHTERLEKFYYDIFVPYVVMNPLYTLDQKICISSFDEATDNFFGDITNNRSQKNY